MNKEEFAKVKSGVELWFDADEIRTRMASRVKLLEKKLKPKRKAKEEQE